MSETDVRTAIADAATSVPGVNVTPWFRQTATAGEGYVRMDVINFPDAFDGVVTWQVCVILPQDIATAEQWIATKASDLRSAVSDELQVRSLRPVQLVIGGTTVPALVIEGQREQE